VIICFKVRQAASGREQASRAKRGDPIELASILSQQSFTTSGGSNRQHASLGKIHELTNQLA